MAYKYIAARHCTNKQEALGEIWSILNSMGWTLHDNQDTNGYRIYTSKGEDEDRINEYVKIDWHIENQIGFSGYYYWDKTNQTFKGGVIGGFRGHVILTSEQGLLLWIYGNKNLVYIVTKVGTTYYANLFGHAPKIIWKTKSNLTDDAAEGSNRTLNIKSTEGFIEGKEYQIIGANGEGRDKLTVTSIINDTQMIVSSLPRNYNKNSIIGEAPSLFTPYLDGNIYLNNIYITCPFNAVGTNNTGFEHCELTSLGSISEIKIYLNPDKRGRRLISDIVFLENHSGEPISCIGLSNEYLLFVSRTDGLTNEDTLEIGKIDKGTATSGGNNTLEDITKNWPRNAHKNKAIIIEGGSGAGQIRKISSNSETQLITEGESWTIDETSKYCIVKEAYRYITRSPELPIVCREGV